MNNMKFRFWDSWNGEYYYSEKHEKLSHFFRLYEMSLEGGNKPVLEQCIEVNKDKPDVYVGDVMITDNEFCLSKIFTVKFNKEHLTYFPVPFVGSWNDYNVGGNIHENPELLTKNE